MPVVSLLPDAIPPVVVSQPTTIEAPKQSIFTELVPPSKIVSLLKYAEGYPWTINYYGQLINVNNTLEHFDPTTPNLTQPYYKVNSLIIQVTSPLSSNYDSTTGVTTITGSAITPYKVRPNVGDVFLAKVDNGEDAIFLVNTVTRKTFRKDTLYEISYTLYSYTSTDPSFVVSLDERVNDTYYFNNDSNFFNRDVLVTPTVHEAINRLKKFMTESQSYYLSTFLQKRTGYLTIPGITDTLYDPFLTDYISRVVDYDSLVDMPFFRHTYSDHRMDQPSILSVILNRNINDVVLANKKYGYIPTSTIANRSRYGTIFHTGVNYMCFPIDAKLHVDPSDPTPMDRSVYLTTIKNSLNYAVDPTMIVQTKNNNSVYDLKLLHELFVDDYYIVSSNFYSYLNGTTTTDSISFIEWIIYRYLKGMAIAKEDLVIAVQKYREWSTLHQVYLLPVLWSIVKFSV